MSITPKQLGKYELRERLGHGGAAEVWKAFDTQLQRYVAIKVLHPNLRDDPDFINRFQREARFIASLHHPNIVQLHDFQVYRSTEGESEAASPPLAYMVMEYIEGPTLADYIQRTSGKGQLPTPLEVVNLFTSICLAVDYAHQQGMLHRDIKPANILLDTRNTLRNPVGEPVLTDFGVARLLSTSSNTLSGAQMGTPLYISPEQASGQPGDERSDLYSLGIILYEMVTGVTPFRGATPLDVMTQHINTVPTVPSSVNPHIPPALNEVIMRCLAKDPAARFSNASSLAAAVAQALNVPTPEGLAQPPDLQHMPTQLEPRSTPLPAHGNVPVAMTPVQPVSQVPTGGQPSTPNASLTPVLLQSRTQVRPAPVTPLPPVVSYTPPQPKRARRSYIFLIPLLIVLLLISGLGAYLLARNTIFAPPAQIGHAFYVSSGQLNEGTAQGIADQLKINLHDVSLPQQGKSYYAWLLGDKHPETNPDLTGPRPITAPILLTNNLSVHNGMVDYLFRGDPRNNNLISTTSRLLITEEDAGKTPSAPSQDHKAWRYYAQIPQEQIPGDKKGFSALVHIRHLFYNETNAKVKGLYGGLDIWMLRNTEKLLEWAVSARDNWHGQQTDSGNAQLMGDQFIRILDYLDGIPNLHVDLPTDTPILADKTSASIALLTVDPEHQGKTPDQLATNPPGYVDHVQLHVSQVSRATDIPPELRQRTAHILDAVNRAKQWLIKAHDIAVKLFFIKNNLSQLQKQATGGLLDDLVNNTTYAYIGYLDPATNTVQPGVLQAHYEIQQLSTLNVSSAVPDSL